MDDLSASRTTAALVAWAGAALFMVSLNGGFVALLWGMHANEQSSASALTNAVINALLFTVFALHHSLLARTGAKQAVRSLRLDRQPALPGRLDDLARAPRNGLPPHGPMGRRALDSRNGGLRDDVRSLEAD